MTISMNPNIRQPQRQIKETYSASAFEEALVKGHRFPGPVTVNGDLNLYGVTYEYVKKVSIVFPSELTINGALKISNFNKLAQLPSRIIANGLDLTQVIFVNDSSLPEELEIKESIRIQDCKDISFSRLNHIAFESFSASDSSFSGSIVPLFSNLTVRTGMRCSIDLEDSTFPDKKKDLLKFKTDNVDIDIDC